MKHMKKRISCMILTATLLAGGSLEYAVAAEEQQNVSEIVTEEQVEIQSEEIVPQEEMVQTEEQAAATECQVVLETYTDGKLDEEHIGGTLTADKLSGHSGEWVTLTVKANHGYVFQRYDTNTDNLVTIDNNRFQLNEKFPTVVVKAYFTTREPGKDEVFFDDFGSEPGAALPEGVHISNGELVVDIPEGQGSNFYEPAIDWSQVSAQEGYRISVDVRRVTQTSGTMQIAFRGGEQSTQRYVVAINSQGSLMLRKIDGTNVELKKAAFQLTDQYAHIEVTVVKNEVRVSANGQELLAYTEQNNWGGMTPKVQLWNMTQGASMGFDNLLVEKICEKKPIEVVTIYNGQEDLEHRAGTAVSDVAEAKAGDTVTLQTIPKAGYRFKEYQVEGMESLSIVDNKFVMPAGEFEKLRVNAVFEDDTVREAKTFYVDSEGGNDQSAGTSEKEAWRTLGRIKEQNLFVPGDRILLKCCTSCFLFHCFLHFLIQTNLIDQPICFCLFCGVSSPICNFSDSLFCHLSSICNNFHKPIKRLINRTLVNRNLFLCQLTHIFIFSASNTHRADSQFLIQSTHIVSGHNYTNRPCCRIGIRIDLIGWCRNIIPARRCIMLHVSPNRTSGFFFICY